MKFTHSELYSNVKKLLKEDSMSKYDKIKQRIEALDNGWTKEADDVITEINPNGNRGKTISIPAWDVQHGYYIEILDGNKKGLKQFDYSTQCEKLDAFKKALLWLLDHSNIKKDERQEKVEALEKQIKDLQREVNKLKEG